MATAVSGLQHQFLSHLIAALAAAYHRPIGTSVA
jgi:hypothetical protein